MAILSSERLEELKRLCDEATPAPWAVSDGFADAGYQSVVLARPACPDLIELGPVDECNNARDASFIATTRTALPDMLETLDELGKEAERLRAIEMIAKDFCDSIDQGKVPSARIYAAFKERLER